MKNILLVILMAVFAVSAYAVDSETSASKRYFFTGKSNQESKKLESKEKEQNSEKIKDKKESEK